VLKKTGLTPMDPGQFQRLVAGVADHEVMRRRLDALLCAELELRCGASPSRFGNGSRQGKTAEAQQARERCHCHNE